MDILLKEAQTKKEVYHIRVSTGLTAQEVGSGHVIVYPPFDEADVACSFDLISAPYLYDPTDKEYTVAPVTYKGVQLTEDGELQTTKKLPAGTSAYEASVWSRYYNYIAFTGDYGVGTYLDFEFTGDRMPQVMFFSNLVYCFLYGTVLSAVLSRNIPPRDPFARKRAAGDAGRENAG